MNGANPKKKQHQTQSFEQLVSKASLERLKPYIEQQVKIQGHLVTQKVAKIIMDPITQLQTRLMAFERVAADLLNVSFADFSNKIASQIIDLEDAALGMAAVEYAEKGDTVRLYIESKETAEGEWDNGTKLRIDKLLNVVEGRVQTFQAVEEAVVEMRAGEVKEFPVKLDDEDSKETLIRVTVERVSRSTTPPKEEATTPATTGEGVPAGDTEGAQGSSATEEAKVDGQA